jgi:hypothetical protein
MEFQQIVCNRDGQVRHDRIGDKEYLVVPMVMVVEGVLNGSSGPLLYPSDELSKFPESWNTKPVVVYHPSINGRALSACDPDILSVQGVGMIMNSRFEKPAFDKPGKLKAEAWLDPDRINVVDDRVGNAIENNQMMELSTGLHLEVENREGKFGETPYSGIARNFRPDHLAILPDQVGACSVKDGAGFLRANDADSNYLWVDSTGKKFCQIRNDKGELDADLLNNAVKSIPGLEVSDSRKAAMLARVRQMIRRVKKGDTTANAKDELSFDTIREMLREKLNRDNAWVSEVFPSSFVYMEDGAYYQQSYSMKDDEVVVEGIPVHVVRTVRYVEANGKQIVGNVFYEELAMTKTEMVAHLIKSGRWGEKDQTVLNSLEETTLLHLVNKADAEVKADQEAQAAAANADQEKQAVANATAKGAEGIQPPKPQTAEEYIASAPSGIREVLNHGVRAYQNNRATLIQKIMANKRNPFSQIQLEGKSLEDLEGIAKLAEEPEAPVAANYGGMGPVNNGGKPEEALALPSMSFDK